MSDRHGAFRAAGPRPLQRAFGRTPPFSHWENGDEGGPASPEGDVLSVGPHGMSTIGASRGACFAASSLTAARSDSSSASAPLMTTSGPPNLVRPHPTTGCSGVFCNSCDELHSIHECLVSRSLARNSSTRRDLPMPGCRPCREPWAAYFSVSRALSVTTRQGAQSRRCSSRQARASRPAGDRGQPGQHAVRQVNQIRASLGLLATRGRAYRLFDLNFSPRPAGADPTNTRTDKPRTISPITNSSE